MEGYTWLCWYVVLAKELNVSKNCIRQVKNNKTWKTVK